MPRVKKVAEKKGGETRVTKASEKLAPLGRLSQHPGVDPKRQTAFGWWRLANKGRKKPLPLPSFFPSERDV